MKIKKSAFMGQNSVGVGKPIILVGKPFIYPVYNIYREREGESEERLKEDCYKRWKSIYNC